MEARWARDEVYCEYYEAGKFYDFNGDFELEEVWLRHLHYEQEH